MKTIIILILIFIGLVSMAVFIDPQHSTKTCTQYKSQKEAQKDLKYNPRLDGNHDGIACNSYNYK